MLQYHLSNQPTAQIARFIWVPIDRLCNTIVLISELHKPTSSLNGQFKISHMVARFREVFLNTIFIKTFEENGKKSLAEKECHGLDP